MPAATTEPAATSAPRADAWRRRARPSRSRRGTRSPSIAPCTTQLCPTVAPSPTSVVSPGGPWITALSCTLAPRAHDHGRVVGADHRAVPDRRALLDDHVADERRGRRDERAPGGPAGVSPSNENSGMARILRGLARHRNAAARRASAATRRPSRLRSPGRACRRGSRRCTNTRQYSPAGPVMRSARVGRPVRPLRARRQGQLDAQRRRRRLRPANE